MCTATVRYTPDKDYAGTDTFTYRVSDGPQSSAPATASITVIPTNDPPALRGLPRRVDVRKNGSATVSFTVADPDTNLTSLIVTATSSNPTIIPNAGLVPGGSGANRTLVITPAANKKGDVTVTVSVSDGTATTTDTIDVKVK